MDTSELYIPPCCIHKQLPPLLSQSPISYFYSRSDWGVPKLWDAVSLLVERDGSDVLSILVINSVDVYLLRYLAQWMRLDYTHAICLVTSEDQTEMVKTELDGLLDRVWYAPLADALQRNNLWIRVSSHASLIISGPMYKDEKGLGNGEMSSYTSTYSIINPKSSNAKCKTDYQMVLARCIQAFRPWRTQCRLHATIKGTDPVFHPLLT